MDGILTLICSWECCLCVVYVMLCLCLCVCVWVCMFVMFKLEKGKKNKIHGLSYCHKFYFSQHQYVSNISYSSIPDECALFLPNLIDLIWFDYLLLFSLSFFSVFLFSDSPLFFEISMLNVFVCVCKCVCVCVWLFVCLWYWVYWDVMLSVFVYNNFLCYLIWFCIFFETLVFVFRVFFMCLCVCVCGFCFLICNLQVVGPSTKIWHVVLNHLNENESLRSSPPEMDNQLSLSWLIKLIFIVFFWEYFVLFWLF